jgi:hypothetical protein
MLGTIMRPRFNPELGINPDQETLMRAVEEARGILGEYIKPGPGNPTRTVERLLAVLDRNEVIRALDRMRRRRGYGWPSEMKKPAGA